MYVQDCTGISHVYVSCEIQCQVDVYVYIYIYTWKITKIDPYKDGLVPVLPVRPPKKGSFGIHVTSITFICI